MRADPRAPSAAHVVWAIARRELGIAYRRRIVRMLFVGSLVPPLVMATILIVRVMARQVIGQDMGWDPVLMLLRVQALPVALLALGLGTPAVSRDRSEDVLYLYAVRPVTPWTYTAGKIAAVMLPAFLLLFVPAALIVGLREGILGAEVATADSLTILLKSTVAAFSISIGYAGVSLGPSALMRRARWALLTALLLFAFPEPLKLLRGSDSFSIGPASAARDLLEALFDEQETLVGVVGGIVLLAYGFLGLLIARIRVQKEMTP